MQIIHSAFLVPFLLFFIVAAVAEGQKLFTIQELVHTALDRSPELKLLDEEIRRSRLELKNARTAYVPHLYVQGSAGVDLFSPGSFEADRNLGSDLILDWNFFQNGLVFFRVAQARAQVEMNMLRRKRQAVDLAYDIKSRAYDLMNRKAVLGILEMELALTEKVLERVKTEFERGKIRRADLMKAQSQVFDKRNSVEKSRREYERMMRRLREDAHLAPEEHIHLETDARHEPLKPQEDYLSLALKYRTDVREGDIQVDLSRKAVRVAKLGRLPRLDLFAGNAFSLDDFERSDDQFQFRTGVIARYPLYDGGQTKLQIFLAELALQKAEFQRSHTRRKVMDEIEDAYDEVADAMRLLESGVQQLTLTQEEFAKAELEFQSGSLSPYEMEEARLSLERAQVRVLELKTHKLKSEAGLVRAVGFVDLVEEKDAKDEAVG